MKNQDNLHPNNTKEEENKHPFSENEQKAWDEFLQLMPKKSSRYEGLGN